MRFFSLSLFLCLPVWGADYLRLKWKPHQTAVIVVDMWDRHHCLPSEKRSHVLAKKIDHFLPALRDQGVTVIFAPSGTMSFYSATVQRKQAIVLSSQAKNRESPKFDRKEFVWMDQLKNEPSMPVSSGCENPKLDKPGSPWSRQTDILKIREADLISDSGEEISNILKLKGIRLVLYAGVHSNICVVGRPFGMRNLGRQGFQTVLIRDLTDSFSVKSKRFFSQSKRNRAVVKHIETYIGPTIHSRQLRRSKAVKLLRYRKGRGKAKTSP